MTEAELLYSRKRYEEIKQAIIEANKREEEIKKLKTDPKVARYIELQNKLKSDELMRRLTACEIVDLSFAYATTETTEKYNIYVDVGTYIIGEYNYPQLVDEQTPEDITKNIIYKNIETKTPVYIKKENQEEFEKNNIVVRLPKCKNLGEANQMFKNLRIWFLTNLLQESDNVVIRKLTKLTDTNIRDIAN